MLKLMSSWQAFWRDRGHLLAAEVPLHQEAAPHLMLAAFVQQIVDGVGWIEREWELGLAAPCLLIRWKNERHAIASRLAGTGRPRAMGCTS